MNSSIREVKSSENSRLYEFLATNYNISNLANKIGATQKASMSIWNLKKMVSSADSTTVKSA